MVDFFIPTFGGNLFNFLYMYMYMSLKLMFYWKEWIKTGYPLLAEAIKTTKTFSSFHFAEENEKEFPHDDVRDDLL